MTCAATIQTAAHGGHTASPRRPATSRPSAPCGPVGNIGNGPTTDGSRDFIERCAARLRHANLIQRARFVRLHQILSKREGRA